MDFVKQCPYSIWRLWLKETEHFFFHLSFQQDGEVEAPEEGSRKTKSFFVHAVDRWDAEFYVKVNDNVNINIGKLYFLCHFTWRRWSELSDILGMMEWSGLWKLNNNGAFTVKLFHKLSEVGMMEIIGNHLKTFFLMESQ